MAAVGWLLLVSVPILLMPFDPAISEWFGSLHLPGDVEKDMDAFQQFGQFGSLVLILVLICLLEPPAIRRTLLDLALAVLVAVGCALILKTLFGRVRPYVEAPTPFLGAGESAQTEWNQRASMPSSHATAAAVLAVYLAWIRPRIALLAIILATLVAIWRVRVQAHFASDVAAGLLLGALIAGPIIRRHWGVRLLDWTWRRWVDTTASPAHPAVDEMVQSRQPTHLPPKTSSVRRTVAGLVALALVLLVIAIAHRPSTADPTIVDPKSVAESPDRAILGT